LTQEKDLFPAYRALLEAGKLKERAAKAEEALQACRLCGRACCVDRTEEPGTCLVADRPYVASYGPHHGEEDPLRGTRGSGTIFFSGCNLGCVYCQNYDISQGTPGRAVTVDELAEMMLELQKMGTHNVNLVSPSHVVPHIIAAVAVAAPRGLRLPLVYNSGGYDSQLALRMLDGLVDIYMPDMKYASAQVGERLSGVPDYPTVNQAAVREMHRQVGDLDIDERGVARRGLLIRHLVLPNGLAGTEEIARFLAEEISRDTYINVMAQYRPAYRAREYPEIDRPLTHEEYREAVEAVLEAGLHRLDRRRSWW
jgi:putative pyruvate formate lyase activating enzyme